MNDYVHLRIKEETRRLIKAYASIEGVSIDEMVNKMIENYKLNGNKTKPMKYKGL